MTKVNKKLILIGAGGHAKVCYDIAQKMDNWNEIIILDDNAENDYFKISGSINEYENYIKNSEFFVAIGDNEIREKLTNKLLKKDAIITTLIHPQAVTASDVVLGIGSIVMAGVVINSATRIGKGCIVNTSSSIDHDNIIGDFVHISPGVHLAGAVKVGKKSWIGIGTNILNYKEIGSNITIGGGSVVAENIKKKGLYVGTPARMVLYE